MTCLFARVKKINRTLAVFLSSLAILVLIGWIMGLSFPAVFAQFGTGESSQSAGTLPSAVPTPSPLFSPTSIPAASPEPQVLAVSDDPLLSKKLPLSSRVDGNKQIFEDELIVIFKDGVSEEEQRRILKENSLYVARDNFHKLMKDKVVRVDPAKRDEVLAKLKNDSNIQFIGLNGVLKSKGYQSGAGCSPNDPVWCSDSQWGLQSIFAPAGWNINRGNSFVVVAVIGSGVDYNNWDLGLFEPWGTSDGRVIKGRDFYDVNVWDNNPMDTDGHETFIAGIIGARTDNGVNVAGVDWNSKIVAIKVGRPDAVYGWIMDFAGMKAAILEAIDPSTMYYLDYNAYYTPPPAKIINISYGTSDYSNYIKDAVAFVQQAGALIIASTDHDLNNPSNGNCFVGFPAALPGVIAVTAIDSNLNRRIGCTNSYNPADGQNYHGPTLAAPGVDIAGLDIHNSNGTGTWSGTSFAAAYVSGVASVLASCSPNSASITSDLINGARNLGPPGWDSDTGYGEVNLWKSLVQTCVLPAGDVNCDGVINSVDAWYILKYVLGFNLNWSDICPVFMSQADVDRDGDIDSRDAWYVLQYAAGVRNPQTQALIAPAVDSDGDGMTDQEEAAYSCLNPNVADANADFDHDGLTNIQERTLGTNPCVSDTDGDGFSDYIEFYVGTNPLVKCGINAWPPDINNDGKVTLADVLAFSPAFGTSKGSPKYNSRFDLNADGKISLADLLALSPVFGKTCSL